MSCIPLIGSFQEAFLVFKSVTPVGNSARLGGVTARRFHLETAFPHRMNQLFVPAVELQNQETDFNLLTIVGCAEYDEQAAEAALRELYDRHACRLKDSGIKKRWETLGIDVDEMVIRTFEKIWIYAERFDPAKAYPGKSLETAVSLWIFKIFENAFRSELRMISRRRNHAPQVLLTVDTILEAEDQSDEPDDEISEKSIAKTPRVAWTREWLDTLSQGDWRIMILSADYIHPTTGRCEIPAEELAALAGQLNLAPASIKVKRQRMIRRLQDFIAEKEKSEKNKKNERPCEPAQRPHHTRRR